MAIVVNNPSALNLLLLYPCATISRRSQANAMSNDVQSLNALAIRQLRVRLNTPLHNPDGQVRVRLRLPVILLIASAEDSATAGGAAHDVHGLFGAVVGAGEGVHALGFVSDDDNLASGWVDLFIGNATEFTRGEAGAVQDYVGF